MTLKSRGITPTEMYDVVSFKHWEDGRITDNSGSRERPTSFYELISDENPKWKRFGNCNHTKIIGERGSGKLLCYNGTVDFYTDCFSHVVPTYGSSFTGEMSFAQVAAEAYLTMKPSLNSGFSLSNFIIELAELKFLLTLWSKGSKLIARYLAQSRKEQLAQGFLGWNFAVKPLVRDLQTIYDKLSNMEKTLNDYKSRQGKTMTSHWKYKAPSKKASKLQYDLGVYTYKTVETYDETYHATMRYTYVVPRVDQEYAKIRGILDVLGLKISPSVIWEAIPFSFVVDWFYGVGEYLSKVETDYLESVVTIQDFCVSQKKIITRHDTNWYENQKSCNPWRSTRTDYVRRRMLPDVNDFGIRESHRYGSKQMLLSAALLVA